MKKIITSKQLFLLCLLRKVMIEAKNTVAVDNKEPEFHMFSVYGPNETGVFELNEMSGRSSFWMIPGQPDNLLTYKGDFELKEPLTKREEFVMTHFFSAQASFVDMKKYAELEKEHSTHVINE